MQFSWWTFFIQAANFLILVWLLKRLLFQPVHDIMEKRRQLSEAAVREAKQARAQADAGRRRYDEALAAIDAQQHEAIAAAHQQIERDRQAILDEAKAKAARDIDEARKVIELERKEAVQASRDEVADLAVELARTLLVDVADDIPRSASLARLEKELTVLSPRERDRFEREISQNGGALEVITESTLSAHERELWQAMLQKELRHPLQLTFKCDPGLISGARLHLPHASVSASLSDRLSAATNALLRGDGANDSR